VDEDESVDSVSEDHREAHGFDSSHEDEEGEYAGHDLNDQDQEEEEEVPHGAVIDADLPVIAKEIVRKRKGEDRYFYQEVNEAAEMREIEGTLVLKSGAKRRSRNQEVDYVEAE
jgi:hypothetical protein